MKFKATLTIIKKDTKDALTLRFGAEWTKETAWTSAEAKLELQTKILRGSIMLTQDNKEETPVKFGTYDGQTWTYANF